MFFRRFHAAAPKKDPISKFIEKRNAIKNGLGGEHKIASHHKKVQNNYDANQLG